MRTFLVKLAEWTMGAVTAALVASVLMPPKRNDIISAMGESFHRMVMISVGISKREDEYVKQFIELAPDDQKELVRWLTRDDIEWLTRHVGWSLDAGTNEFNAGHAMTYVRLMKGQK